MDSDDERFQEAEADEVEVAAEVAEEAAAAVAVPRPFYHRRYIDRDHAGADRQLMEDYFSENARYPAEIFRRRFRMSQQLFVHIATCLAQRFKCFNLRYDATGRPGLSTYQKCTVAIRQLAYAGPADMFDEYLQMSETTALQTLRQFCRGIKDIFKGEFLRKPTTDDCQSLIDMHGTSIRQPVGQKQTYFAKKQEGARKDVERAFGVLQAQWAIIRCPV
ncbi:uncharacterized protein LOC121810645 [Salvia splendens]|uniref:uncharacterized protein LOC121810645 n=1 Tax=Salvia splendens TaxID=180675 RepID=UPI001C25975C|nr:uncharacterized protein LOC121810645 [Salvia splendens]